MSSLSSTSSSPRSARPASPGPRIGPFHIGAEIGKGSFAIVHRGYAEGDRSHAGVSASSPSRRDVAIKIVVRRKLTQKLSDNLESEIAILKAVRHPNIVELIDCLKTESHICLIMDFSSGGDLSQYIRRKGVMTDDPNASSLQAKSFVRASKKYPHPSDGGLNDRVVRSFVEQLASAMEFMRARNIVHRDIKPQNLLLQPPGPECLTLGHPEGIPQMKVADFGFARSLPAASLAETLCGSPLYMAPEILRHERYDAKADLWSIGAVTYEMIVGKPHFRAANYVELLRRIERDEDRIRFPDERSQSTWLREVEKRREAGENISVEEEKRGPTAVAEDLKTLVRGLLKRHAIERMSFDEFFNNPVILAARPEGAKRSDRTDAIGIKVPLGAAAIGTSTPSPTPKPTPGPSLPLQPASSQRVHAPPPLPSIPPLPKFAPKYIVAKDTKSEASTSRRAKEQQPSLAAPSDGDAVKQAGKDRSADDGCRSVDPPAETQTTATANAERVGLGPEEDDDSQYVMVEKRSVDEYAGALGAAPTVRSPSGAAHGAISAAAKLARRPSQLTMTLTSGINAAVGAVSGSSGAILSSAATQTSAPTSSTQRKAEGAAGSPKRAIFPPGALVTALEGSEASVAMSGTSKAIAISGTTPPSLSSSPSAPFALPPGLRRQSFLGRRTSSFGQAGTPLSPRLGATSSLATPSSNAVDVSAHARHDSDEKGALCSSPSATSADAPTSTDATRTAYTGSALARVISNASQKWFGLPAGMGLLATAALVRTRGSDNTNVALGAGSLAAARQGDVGVVASAGDAERGGEASLLLRLDDLGQKAYVLAEFADSKMSSLPSAAIDGGLFSYVADYSTARQRSPSLSSSPHVSAANATGSSTAEAMALEAAVAQEALLIYIKSLGFLQKAIELVRTFVDTGGSAAGGDIPSSRSRAGEKPPPPSSSSSSPLSQPRQGTSVVSADISDAVTYLKKRFNETFEKAEYARGKASEAIVSGSSNVDVNRIIYDKAMEIARAAALEELENNHTTFSVGSRGGGEGGGGVGVVPGGLSGTSPSSLSSDGRGTAAMPGAGLETLEEDAPQHSPAVGTRWDIQACLLAYETAEIMLASLLDATRLDRGAGAASGVAVSSSDPGIEATTALTIAPFIKSIGHRCQILRGRVLASSGQAPVSRPGGVI